MRLKRQMHSYTPRCTHIDYGAVKSTASCGVPESPSPWRLFRSMDMTCWIPAVLGCHVSPWCASQEGSCFCTASGIGHIWPVLSGEVLGGLPDQPLLARRRRSQVRTRRTRPQTQGWRHLQTTINVVVTSQLLQKKRTKNYLAAPLCSAVTLQCWHRCLMKMN